MSIRLAVYSHESRPLDGLVAQLQCAGYDVFERYTPPAYRDLIAEQAIDVLIIDARVEGSLALIEGLSEQDRRILLVWQEGTPLPDTLPAGVDDVIMLPVPRHDLPSRIRNLARFGSMKDEAARRRQALLDFNPSATTTSEAPPQAKQAQILLVGAITDEHITLIDALNEIATFAYAETSEHALQVLDQGRVDLVFVGSSLPSQAFKQLCDFTRKSTNLADTPFILSENLNDLDDGALFLQSDQFNLLRMPFYPAGLRRRIEGITAQYRLRRQLRALPSKHRHGSTIDSLTGLYSHGFLYHYLDNSLAACRARGLTLSVTTCTIKGLGDVNEMLGYPSGDRLISDLTAALARSCRAQDLVARIQGNSFCIVLADATEHEARIVCQRTTAILRSIVAENRYRLFHVNLAVGIAEASHEDEAKTLIERALCQPQLTILSQAS